MHVQQSAVGDPLGVIEQGGGLGADGTSGLIALGRQLARLEVGGHDVVLPAGEEHRGTRVALAPGPATQLVVEALGAVASGADQMQAAEFGDGIVVGFIGTAQPDIGAATGHLGGHRHDAELAGLGDHQGLFLVVLGIEDHGRDAAAHQSGVQVLGLGDVLGTDQDRLAGGVDIDDVVDDALVLGRGGDVDPVGLIDPDVGRVGRDG